MTALAPAMSPETGAVPATVIHLGRLSTVVRRGLLLLGEVVAVPGVLLYAFVAAGRPMAGIVAILAWRVGCVGLRLVSGSRVPTTCWFAAALFLARTVAGLLVSSVSLYLLLPAMLCAGQGVLFLGSALTRRPLLMRLATDYIDDIPDRRALRRLLTQLTVLWGGVHLLAACAGAWAVTLSPRHAVAMTSTLSLACTLGSVGGCIAWGLWRAARIPGLRIACREKPEPAAFVAPVGDAAMPEAA